MSLRPRYSLLTLLVLTALVPSGVKLWYGPHHVVDISQQFYEKEYTYTRDWAGNEIIDGVKVIRYEQPQGTPKNIAVFYYWQGLDTDYRQDVLIDAKAKKFAVLPNLFQKKVVSLSAQEHAEHVRATRQECERLQALGFREDEDYFLGTSN
jgi:hypothetical protein